jgi:hypothetical protein
MTTLNKGYAGIVTAVSFNKETNSIEIILQSIDQSRLMRHKVGAMQGISKKESAQLWRDLHAAMDNQDYVQFYYRGNWKAWFDKFDVIEDSIDETFAQMIGVE